jgi:hypothetical protein
MQFEYIKALKEGSPAKAKWVRILFVLGLVKSILLAVPVGAIRAVIAMWKMG